jgi:hypothetical protein
MSTRNGTHWTKAVLVQDWTRPNTERRCARTWAAGTPVIVEWFDSTATRAYVWCGHNCLFSVSIAAAHKYVKSVR